MLETWLSQELLDPSRRTELRERFLDDPARIIAIDDALLPERYTLLSRALRQDCAWHVRYGVQDYRTEWVEAQDFANVPDDRRMFRHGAFASARPGRELSDGMLGLVRIKLLFASAMWSNLIESLTGSRVTELQEMLVRRMGPGDLARPHDDAIAGRRICLLLYFTDNWTPAHGGRFVLHAAGGDRFYDPRPNRMILFDVGVRQNHSVEAFTPGPSSEDPWRYNFSVWFR